MSVGNCRRHSQHVVGGRVLRQRQCLNRTTRHTAQRQPTRDQWSGRNVWHILQSRFIMAPGRSTRPAGQWLSSFSARIHRHEYAARTIHQVRKRLNAFVADRRRNEFWRLQPSQVCSGLRHRIVPASPPESPFSKLAVGRFAQMSIHPA